MSSPIQLDVGGTIFETSKSTLTRFDGFFKTMLETNVPVERNQSGHIFLDRDPTHFQVILNFMRDGDVDLPDSEETVKKISREANYFLLNGLMELCNQKLKNSAVNNLPMSRMKFLETYDQVLRVIANPQKPVIIIYYVVSHDGLIEKPLGVQSHQFFDITQFLDKYENTFDVYFKQLDYKRKEEYRRKSWHLGCYYKNNVISESAFSCGVGMLEKIIAEFIERIE